MALKFRRGTTAQKSGSLAFGEPYVNTTLGTLQIGGPDGDITLGSTGTGSTGVFGAISGSGLDITGNANIAGNLTLGGQLTIGDNTSDTVNVVASLSSSLIPSITNTFDLGSANYYWRDLYISTGSIKFVGAAGVVVGTLTNTGNGLNLDGGIVTNGNSSFGTSSLSSTSVTGSFAVSGYTTLNGDVRILQSLSVENDITASNLNVVNNLKIGGSLISTVIKNKLNTESVISGSSQITLSSTTGGGISDNVRFGSLGIGMAASGTSGRIDAAGDIVAYSTSDRNFKENITPIPNAIDKIRKISGNTYDWKVELKDIHGFEGNDVGVIAQEIEEVLPQLVTTRDTGYKAVKYDKLVALLIEGIKDQQNQIDNLTIEVENLKKAKGL